jgi:hypothetical protein
MLRKIMFMVQDLELRRQPHQTPNGGFALTGNVFFT